MKKCFTCKLEKPFSEFHSDKGKKDGYSSYCRNCFRKRDKDYYKKNKITRYAQYKGRKERITKENTEKLWKYLQSHPCVDCKEKDILVLQFDHQRDKTKMVSSLINNGLSWRRILLEIDKCEVVCANCHTRRTAKQQGWKKFLFLRDSGVVPRQAHNL